MQKILAAAALASAADISFTAGYRKILIPSDIAQ